MPSPMVGRKLGIDSIPAPDPARVKGTRVLGISGSSGQEPGMSKSERLLISALGQCTALGCETTFIRLKDLKIYECEGNYSENPDYCMYPCQSTMKYEDDEMDTVYTAVLDCDVLFLATPIRWNNHSALVQKFVERMNCIENQYCVVRQPDDQKQGRGAHYHRSRGRDAARGRKSFEFLCLAGIPQPRGLYRLVGR